MNSAIPEAQSETEPLSDDEATLTGIKAVSDSGPSALGSVSDCASPVAELALRELLDPAAWQEGLEKYAAAMHLGVALVDADGRLLGPCLNARPLWRLLRGLQPPAAGECPFALAPLRPCRCVADALNKRGVVRRRDRTGLVHFAVPLALGERRLGALVAGQVFDQFPEQLPLQQAAAKLGLSPGKVWQVARLEHPVSPSMLRVYEDLLTTLGQAFLQRRQHTLLEASRLAELRRAEEVLRGVNDELERRVEERTAALAEAQKKMLHAERLAAIGEMVAGLAHESRNALQRSDACVERLSWRVQDRPDALDLVGRIRAANDDLRRLFEDVRAYAGPVRLDLDYCDLAEVWRDAWAQLAPGRGSRDVLLCEDTEGVDLEITGDGFRLRQVFANIFDNALAACADPVRITVRCEETSLAGRPAVRVAVSDNGPGLNDEQRQKIFEPFYTTKAQGTGLGMAIAKRIVEAHGGELAVGQRNAPGAEIHVTLPLRRP
jgi:signal transduction histidine kinase